jgi:outer membrane immunogenic protein
MRGAALIVAGTAFAALALSNARADDARWSGFYSGAQLGGAWSDDAWRYQNANYFNTLGPTVVGNGFGQNTSGVIGGILGGYNYRVGSWVLGGELTASAANMRDEQPSPFFPKLDATTNEIKWLTTATGRLGYVWDRWLVYAKGGWAGGEVRLTAVDISAGVTADDKQWANGWTIGAGGEYMLTDGISLGVGYDYADLSINNQSATCPGCAGPPSLGFGTPIVDADIKVQSVMVRLGFYALPLFSVR